MGYADEIATILVVEHLAVVEMRPRLVGSILLSTSLGNFITYHTLKEMSAA